MAVRAEWEPRFGHDFSQVRVHSDAWAAEAAAALGSRAFTVGRDIVFGVGQWAPHTDAGRRLLVHELSHVVQQRAVSSASLDGLQVSSPTEPAERLADDVASGAQPASALSAEPMMRLPTARIQRAPQPGAAPPATPPVISSPSAPAGDVIQQAIDLFAASPSAQKGDGKRIVEKLLDLHRKKEIGYEELIKPGSELVTAAESRESISGWGRFDIAIDVSFSGDIARTSLELVHEAIHRLYDERVVEEELKTRNAQIDYYADLTAGVRLGGRLYKAPPGFDPDIEMQREERKLGRLIDVIVSRYDKPGFDAAWVERHIDDWGGIANRWPWTKAEYIKPLLHEEPIRYGSIVLRLLESEAGNATNLSKIVGWVGKARLRDFLQPLLFSPQYYNRIRVIQQKTKVDLGLKP
jgi:hypothetical protein